MLFLHICQENMQPWMPGAFWEVEDSRVGMKLQSVWTMNGALPCRWDFKRTLKILSFNPKIGLISIYTAVSYLRMAGNCC